MADLRERPDDIDRLLDRIRNRIIETQAMSYTRADFLAALNACGLEVVPEGTAEFLQGARIRKYGLNAKGYPEFTLVYPTRAGLDADHIAECFRRAASLTGEE